MDQPNPFKAKLSSAPPPAKPNTKGVRSWRVCVVEDSYTTLPTVFKALKTRGHDVDQFSTGEDAYQALVSTHYDAIIIGQAISSGALDHQALIRKIRSDASTKLRNLPVVALSLSDNPSFEAALRSAGADQVLTALSTQSVYDAVTNAISADRKTNSAELSLPKVCLLEDSYARSLTLSALIAKQGYDIDHVTREEEALQSLAANQYDIFFIGQAGSSNAFNLADFVQHARDITGGYRRPLHIAIVSATTTPKHLATMMRLGADSVVLEDKHGSYAASLARTFASLKEPVPTLAPTAMRAKMSAPAMQPPPQQAPAPIRRRPAFIPSFSVLLGLVLVAGLWASWYAFGDAQPVEVVAARHGQLTKSVNGIGRIVGKRQVDLTSKHQGSLYKVHVQEGDRVKAGDVLAILDNREALINVKRADATIFRIRTDIDQAEKSVAVMSRMSPGSGVSSQVIGDLHSSVASGRANLRVAEQEAAAARLAVEQLNIVAPFTGLILQSFAVEGRWVESSTPLFTLVDTDVREAAILIDEQDARDVAAGQSVTISDGDNGQEWREKILRVANEAPSVERAGAGTNSFVTAYSSLAPSAQSLPIGSRVFAQIVTESSANTIKVPYETVFVQGGQQFVAVVTDEHIRYRPVRVGIRALTEVEIVDGLVAGDLVVLPRDTLTEGQRVATSSVIMHTPLDDEGYPGRIKYADVPVYNTEQLRKQYDTVLIVDVRSKFEFDVIHIEKAFNVPVSSDTFLQDLEQLRLADASVPLVFYCNGHSCMKSYEAVRKAVAGGFQNVYAYDSGIFDWLNVNRNKATLLGITPAPLDKMVSEEYFQGRLVDFGTFKNKASARNAVVIDVRDAEQRDSNFSLDAMQIPLDELVVKLDQNEFKGKQLLLFDAVGKQVRWLQYILEDRGYRDYFFLKDGITNAQK